MLLINILSIGKLRFRMFSKGCFFIAHYKTTSTAYSGSILWKQNILQQCFSKGERLKNNFKIFIRVKALLCNLSHMAEVFIVNTVTWYSSLSHFLRWWNLWSLILLDDAISGKFGFHFRCSIIIYLTAAKYSIHDLKTSQVWKHLEVTYSVKLKASLTTGHSVSAWMPRSHRPLSISWKHFINSWVIQALSIL